MLFFYLKYNIVFWVRSSLLRMALPNPLSLHFIYKVPVLNSRHSSWLLEQAQWYLDTYRNALVSHKGVTAHNYLWRVIGLGLWLLQSSPRCPKTWGEFIHSQLWPTYDTTWRKLCTKLLCTLAFAHVVSFLGKCCPPLIPWGPPFPPHNIASIIRTYTCLLRPSSGAASKLFLISSTKTVCFL